MLQLISEAKEFEELPVRHNEDKLNKSLADSLPLQSYSSDYGNSHVKTYLLLQAHLSRVKLPIADYVTDTKTVLDNTIRVIQSFVDIAAEKGYLLSTLNLMNVMQMVVQAQWFTDSPFLMLPYIDTLQIQELRNNGIQSLSQLTSLSSEQGIALLSKSCKLRTYQVEQVWKVVESLPNIDVTIDKNIQRDAEQGSLTVRVTLRDRRKNSAKAYTPRFPKPKEEGWWLVIGALKEFVDDSNNATAELMAMRRVKIRKETRTELIIPDMKGKLLTLFLISDCYLGLDQRHQFQVNL